MKIEDRPTSACAGGVSEGSDRCRALAWALVCGCSFSTLTFAQVGGTILDGDAELVRTASSFDSTPEANFLGLSPTLIQDHLFEHGWWFRIAGDPAETAFGIPDSEVYSGDGSTITWNDVDGRGLFSAREVAIVADAGYDPLGDGGFVAIGLGITNLSPTTTLFVSLFHLADIDVEGSADDAAALIEYPHLIRVTDPSGNFAQYDTDVSTASFLVRPFGPTSVRTILNDGLTTDFDDSGLPFAAGDVSMGFQIDLAVGPLGELGMIVYIAVNSSLSCRRVRSQGVFCDGFESGGSGFWSSVVSRSGGADQRSRLGTARSPHGVDWYSGARRRSLPAAGAEPETLEAGGVP